MNRKKLVELADALEQAKTGLSLAAKIADEMQTGLLDWADQMVEAHAQNPNTTPTPGPDPEPDPEQGAPLDPAAVKQVLAETAAAGRAKEVREAIQAQGATRLSELTPKQICNVLDTLNIEVR